MAQPPLVVADVVRPAHKDRPRRDTEVTPIIVGNVDTPGKDHAVPLRKIESDQPLILLDEAQHVGCVRALAAGPIAHTPRVGGLSQWEIGQVAFSRDSAVAIMGQLAAAAHHRKVLPGARFELCCGRGAQPTGTVAGNEVEAVGPVAVLFQRDAAMVPAQVVVVAGQQIGIALLRRGRLHPQAECEVAANRCRPIGDDATLLAVEAYAAGATAVRPLSMAHEPPVAASARGVLHHVVLRFGAAGRVYRVVYELTPGSGQVILVRFKVRAI